MRSKQTLLIRNLVLFISIQSLYFIVLVISRTKLYRLSTRYRLILKQPKKYLRLKTYCL